ncbi:MAG: hypothetical protein HYZ92_02065, partial [Candidatus Omnitrophica bacterium]|nr:hypothetical protein [Candidatus Omnitrophota bacterium]
SGRARANGRSVEQSWIMVWTIRSGMVVRYRYFDDSARWVAAIRGEDLA